jgi:hypothetical protein
VDSVTLVEDQIDTGLILLGHLADEGFDVQAACWIKPVDADHWTLYIATSLVGANGSAEAYRRLIPLLQKFGGGLLTSSDVTLIGTNDPIAQDALDTLKRFPHRRPIPSPRPWIGRIAAAEVYVYPVPGMTPVTIYHLVFPGTEELGVLSLDESILKGKFWSEVDGKDVPGKTGVDCVVAAPVGARLEREEFRLVLLWDWLGRPMRSTANEVWSFAHLGLHGFRFLPESADRLQQGASKT